MQKNNHVKQRLDSAMARRGLAASREHAQRLIMAGRVRVNSRPAAKSDLRVDADTDIAVVGATADYASRGAYKLLAALDHFALDVAGRLALDVGASTGGFTDVLLRRGVAHVIALDVGYGQLAARLRTDPRVTVADRTNIRLVQPSRLLKKSSQPASPSVISPASGGELKERSQFLRRALRSSVDPKAIDRGFQRPASELPYAPDLVVIDTSFISLKLVLAATIGLLAAHADIIVLIKPQFEVGKGKVGKGGVVRDSALRQQAVEDVLDAARALGLAVVGAIESPLTGAAGNHEYLALLRYRCPMRTSQTPIVCTPL